MSSILITSAPLFNGSLVGLFQPVPATNIPLSLENRPSLIKVEKKLEKIRNEIMEADKRHRRLLQSLDLAIEQITTQASVADLAKRHNLSEDKVRRSIENAIFMARTRMYVKKRRNTIRSDRRK